MRVCYFGNYNANYSRNKILIKGLRKNGATVIECNTLLKGCAKYFDLIKRHYHIRKEYDIMIVGFPGFQSMILAKFLTRKPIIFDAFLSIYDSEVFDRQLVQAKSIKARYYWLLDFLSCFLARQVLLDTNEHIDYFVKTFYLKKKKFQRIFVGADDEIFYPEENKNKNSKFIVHFHGSFIPLQGVECILNAANSLKNEDIHFNIIGTKIKNNYENKFFSNITFVNDVKYSELKNYINQADICLGIFGATDKAKRVIPNKIFEALACKKPIITAETYAIKELFENNKNILMCQPMNLTLSILNLKRDNELRKKIADNGFSLLKEKLTPSKITEELIKNLYDLYR